MLSTLQGVTRLLALLTVTFEGQKSQVINGFFLWVVILES